MASGVKKSASGSYLGTGAALEISGEKVGFRPARVSIYRGETRIDKVEWMEGMAADSGFLDKGDDGVRSLLSSGAISQESSGFSLGTNAAVNTSGERYYYFCEE